MSGPAVMLDLEGGLARARPGASLVCAGERGGPGAWLPESVAVWAAELDRPVIVDLSGLPAAEQREYARSFAESWAEAAPAAELFVHVGAAEARPRARPRVLMLGAACLAIAALPVTSVVALAALAGLGLGLALGSARLPR